MNVNPRLLAGPRKRRILRKEAVAGMNRVHFPFPRDLHDPRDVEIRLDGAFALADQVGFVGLEAMQAQPVFLRINGDGAQAEFVCGAQNADGDFAAVGCQELFHHLGSRRPQRLGGVAPRWVPTLSQLGEKVRRYGRAILAELQTP